MKFAQRPVKVLGDPVVSWSGCSVEPVARPVSAQRRLYSESGHQPDASV